MAEYRWDCPHQWLQWRLYHSMNDPLALVAMAEKLAELLDHDQIQDVFESLMDSDGYFQPLEEEVNGGQMD